MRKILFICFLGTIFFDNLVAMSTDSNSVTGIYPRCLQPINAEEYIESCRKFSVKLPTEDIPDIVLECGVNPDKILVITPESIINGAFGDDKKYFNYFHVLLDSKTALKKAFWRFVYSTSVSKDNTPVKIPLDQAENYRAFVFKTIAARFDVKTYRERIVSFLAALEYRKKLNPQFRVLFNIVNALGERFINDNLLLLGIGYVDGRHRKIMNEKTFQLTIPFCFSKFETSEICICMHEIGHATHDLLGIKSKRIPFSLSSENIWMKNTFFPLLNQVEERMSYFLEQGKNSIGQRSPSGEEILGYFKYMVNDIQTPYRKMILPYDEHELRRMGILQIENMLADEKVCNILKNLNGIDEINQDFLANIIRLVAKDTNFFNLWTNAEEMFQIIGVASIGGYIVIDRNADLCALYEQNEAIRWGHVVYNGSPKSDNTLLEVAKMLIPEDNYIDSLFALHGLDYQLYKKQRVAAKKRATQIIE